MKKTSLAAVAAVAMATAMAVTTNPAQAQQVPSSQTSAKADRARVLARAQSNVSDWIGENADTIHKDSADTLRRVNVLNGDNGTTAFAYERSHRGVPVVGGDFVVMTNANGQVIADSVAQTDEIDVASVKPEIARQTAAATAEKQVDRLETNEGTRLVIWQNAATSKLAWETVVRGEKNGEPSRKAVYVNARNGRVLESKEKIIHADGNAGFSGPSPLKFNTTFTGGGFSLQNPDNATMVCQDSATNATMFSSDDVWGNGNSTDKETGCVDGFYSMLEMDKMMKSWLGRNGMDGANGWVPLRVGLDETNAYYDGTQVQIGKSYAGKWISSIDVVAHEYGHGVDDKTPGGISRGQTAEFVADVFGALTEHYSNQSEAYDGPDYLVGEEIDLIGKGPIRNMYNPSAVSDPNCYSWTIPFTEIHKAAGPGNHWFYLLAEGTDPAGKPASKSCNGSKLNGIGIEKAGKIFYNAMLMKTSQSSYPSYRKWTLQAAKNLYPGSCYEFNAVKAAWSAVSVNGGWGEPTCSGTTTSPAPTSTPTPSASPSPSPSPSQTPTPVPTVTPTPTPTVSTTPTPTAAPFGGLLVNGDFEQGEMEGWWGFSTAINNNSARPARSGNWKLWLGGTGKYTEMFKEQWVTIPADANNLRLSYWLRMDTDDKGFWPNDWMRVQVVSGGQTRDLASYTNTSAKNFGDYKLVTHDFSGYAGKDIKIRFYSLENWSTQTSFVIDDVELNKI